MPPKSTGWRKWGERAMVVSDWAGNHANNVGSKFGVERFWPTSNDFALELEKCERILRMFTVEGVPTEENTGPSKKKRKVFRKISPNIIRDAQGLIIFTAMRSGIAPFSGAGGGGLIVTRMSDGSWSPPSFISPNNFQVGAVIGIDVYNAILILRTPESVKGFRTHNLTLGSEMGLAAGPLGGAGISGETGLTSKHKAPIFSYVQSRGFYAGVSLVGQAFIDRFDENERVYHWPGIKAGDIFDGKVRRPYESKSFYIALRDAETGAAQGANLEWDTDEVKAIDLDAGEVLRLPPTPEQLTEWEAQGIKDEDDVRFEEEERKAVRALPPPPMHPKSRNSRSRPTSAASSIHNGHSEGPGSPDASFRSYPSSPLVPAEFAAGTSTELPPPPPPPRRHPNHTLGLGVSSEASPSSYVPAPAPADSSLPVDALPLERMSVEEGSQRLSGDYIGHESEDGPPSFAEATQDQTGEPTIVEKPAQPESLLIPPPLQHQDSQSSVSVYSDASQHTVEVGDISHQIPEAQAISEGPRERQDDNAAAANDSERAPASLS